MSGKVACAFAKYGCRGTFLPAAEEKHLSESLAYHFRLVLDMNERLEKQVSELNAALGRAVNSSTQPVASVSTTSNGSSVGGAGTGATTMYHPGVRHTWAAEDDIFGSPAFELWQCCNQSGPIGRIGGCTLLTAAAVASALASPPPKGGSASSGGTSAAANGIASPNPAATPQQYKAVAASTKPAATANGGGGGSASPVMGGVVATAQVPALPAFMAKTVPGGDTKSAATAADTVLLSPRNKPPPLTADETAALEQYKPMIDQIFQKYSQPSGTQRVITIDSFCLFLTAYQILPDHVNESDVRSAFQAASTQTSASAVAAKRSPVGMAVPLSAGEFNWALTRLNIETTNPDDSPLDRLKSLLAFFQSTHNSLPRPKQ